MERRVERLETGAGIGPVTLRDMLIALNQLQSCEAGTAPAGYTADDAARDYEVLVLQRTEQDPGWATFSKWSSRQNNCSMPVGAAIRTNRILHPGNPGYYAPPGFNG